MTAAIITPRNAFEVHPKFWPKDGMHSTKLKKISTSTAPIPSKFCNGRLWEPCFPIVNAQAIKVLSGRDVILMPDLGATSEWQEKVSMLRPICRSVSVSSVLEDVATEEQRKQGLDIADFLLMKDTPQMILQRMIDKNPVLQRLIDELDLVLVDES